MRVESEDGNRALMRRGRDPISPSLLHLRTQREGGCLQTRKGVLTGPDPAGTVTVDFRLRDCEKYMSVD